MTRWLTTPALFHPDPQSLTKSTGCSKHSLNSSDTALVEERDRLAPLLRHLDEAGQPLHGDASLSNPLSTSTGPRWNDFEDGCFGSPAWDVIGLLDDAREHYSDAFAADMLAAYGRDIEAGLAPLVRDTQTLYGRLWQRYCNLVPGTSP